MAIVLTSSARFQPYSFDEMIRPYQMLTEEYNKREAEIAALDTKAETMRQYAQQEIDAAKLENRQPASFATQYMDYANSLDKAAEDLATKGLRGTSRKSIYDLTNQYQTNVVPIETAIKTRAAKADEQRKALLANPDLRFDTDFSTIGLQELIDNPNLGYTTYNLEDYTKNAILAGTALKANQTPTAIVHPENNQYNIVTQGIPESALNNNEEIESIVQSIIADVPNNLKSEVENIVRTKVQESAKATSKLEVNRGYDSGLTQAQKLSAIQSGYWQNPDTKQWEPDPNNPIWQTRGMYYDKDAEEWKIGQKPGTASTKTDSKSATQSDSSYFASLGTKVKSINPKGFTHDMTFEKLQELENTNEAFEITTNELSKGITKDTNTSLYDILNSKKLAKKLNVSLDTITNDDDLVSANIAAIKRIKEKASMGLNPALVQTRIIPKTGEVIVFELSQAKNNLPLNDVSNVEG